MEHAPAGHAGPAFTSAQEAFAAVADQVPSIKAWSKLHDHSITLLDRVVIEKFADGEITARRTHDRLPVAMPLMITSGWARETVATHLHGLDLKFDAHRDDVRPLIIASLKAGTPDRRLSPRGRREVASALAQSPGRMPGRDVIDHICYTVAEAEELSFKARLQARACGYNRSATGVAKLLNAVLWQDFYDREIASTALLAFGHKATLDQYSLIQEQWSSIENGREVGLKSLLKTHRPAFVLLPALCRDAATPRDAAASRSAYATAPAASGACKGPIYTQLIAKAPARLREVGFKPAFWRFLLRCSVPQIRSMGMLIEKTILSHGVTPLPPRDPSDAHPFDFTVFESNTAAQDATHRQLYLAILNRLSDFDPKHIPMALLQQILWLDAEGLRVLQPYLKAFLDAGRVAKRKRTVKPMAAEIHLIADALRALDPEGRTPAALGNASTTTFASLSRLQQEWHDEQEFENDADLAYRWLQLVEEQTIAGVKVSELTDGHALRAEGRALHHCVAGYAGRCAAGKTRVFSLVDGANPKTRSTLELQFSGSWRVVQHRTYCNQTPSKKLLKAALKVAAAANKAQAALPASDFRLAA